MKRRRCRRWRLVALVGALQAVLTTTAHAQREVSVEGAIFLLRPVGARAVGVGHAVVARRDGSEAIWWNPAGLAAATRREVAVHHSQDFIATGDAISFIFSEREHQRGSPVGGSHNLPLLWEHLKLTGISMGLAMLVALPLGLVLGHTGKGSFLAISTSNVGRAVPSLA